MCGLCGFTLPENASAQVVEQLGIMVDQVAHRGPDERGQHVGDDVAFGFARLGIIDVRDGHQPMFGEDGNVVAMTTGEIYNHVELRQRLEARGHTFRTRCDVEVVPHLYEENGLDFVDHLDGQFAIILHDRTKQLLIGVRDRFGVVPLFYTYQNETLVFGSEIKAILSHPAVTADVDPVGLDQVLTLPGLVSPRTMFRDIRSVPPGMMFLKQLGEAPVERRYWDVVFAGDGEVADRASDAFYAQRLEELLVRSVEKRLQSDVGVGLYLSGGLDSSLVGAIMRQLMPEAEIASFSAAFAERELSEIRHQRLMSRMIGSAHHERFIPGPEIADRLADVVRHTECPIKESFDAAAFMLSGTVHDHGTRVVLTGQGADELLGGYIGYRFDRAGRERSIGRGSDQEQATLRQRLWGDETFVYEGDDLAFRTTRSELYAEGLLEDEPDMDCLAHPLLDQRRLTGLGPLHRRSYIDLKLRLADHLLGDHGDRMAFAHSVEPRHPFLDRDLVEFLANVPPDLKVRNLEEKYVLKQMARKWIPRSIVEREKFGFAAPGSPNLLRQNHQQIDSMLDLDRIRADGWFDPDAVKLLRARYAEPGFRINVPFEQDLLMTVVTFGMFLDTFDLPRRGSR
jgi:asparagine synthase (glutamine-hydrolysing)